MAKITLNIQDILLKNKVNVKINADKSTKLLPELITGEKVRIQRGHSDWISGTVERKADTPRSYVVPTAEAEITKQMQTSYQRNNM